MEEIDLEQDILIGNEAQGSSVETRADMYSLLATVFLAKPDVNFVARMRKQVLGDSNEITQGSLAGDESMQLLARYFREHAGEADEEVLRDILIDRTRIMGGHIQEGIRPPYEATYIGAPPPALILALNRFYRENGFSLPEGLDERCDYVGTELLYLQMLCLREQAEALASGNVEEVIKLEREFFEEHLGCWVFEYAKGILEYAHTDFYRAIAILLRGFLMSEKARFGL